MQAARVGIATFLDMFRDLWQARLQSAKIEKPSMKKQ
jgi:hypothetical protein